MNWEAYSFICNIPIPEGNFLFSVFDLVDDSHESHGSMNLIQSVTVQISLFQSFMLNPPQAASMEQSFMFAIPWFRRSTVETPPSDSSPVERGAKNSGLRTAPRRRHEDCAQFSKSSHRQVEHKLVAVHHKGSSHVREIPA